MLRIAGLRGFCAAALAARGRLDPALRVDVGRGAFLRVFADGDLEPEVNMGGNLPESPVFLRLRALPLAAFSQPFQALVSFDDAASDRAPMRWALRVTIERSV